MRTGLTARFFVAVLIMLVANVLPARASVPNRVVGQMTDGSRVALPHSVPPKAATGTDLGAVAESTRLAGMALRFSMTDAQQAELTQLLADQQDPGSAHFRQWLTPAEFGARFGLSAADVAQVAAWLTAQGFTVDGVANSSTFITFSGTVGQVQAAFGTSVRQLSVDGETHIANVTALTMPRAVAGVVGAVTGISDFRPKARKVLRRGAAGVAAAGASTARPEFTQTTTSGTQHQLAPGDFYTIYDLKPLLSSTPAINGTGVPIAVMGQVEVYPTDLAAFRTASGLAANAPVTKVYGTDPGYPTNACLSNNPPANCNPTADDLGESELDLEWAGATAPGSPITFVVSTDVIRTSLVQAIDNNLAPIISVSYGACEKAGYVFTAAEFTSLNATLQQAATQGISVVAASGDAGATDCDDSGVRSATQGLWVDFPASSPYVTGVGGTEFVEGSGTYWSASNGANGGSALSYIPETVWNDTANDILISPQTATLSAGGGGASVLFTKPTWQAGTGVPADGARDVPDLSFSSSADHDGYLICVLGDCSNGFYSSSNSTDIVGGTSVAAPAFAGILALAEQRLGGARLGNVNPYIYNLAGGSFGSTIFHDVTTGNNKSPCTVGSTGCTSTPIGYNATVGYDLASGWGSLDVYNFVNNLSSATLQKATTTTVTYTPSSPQIGQSVTFTASVAGPSGATTVPTGTVTFSVNGVAGSPVAVSATGTATLTTTFATGGQQTVTAVYSGDTTYYGSTGQAVATLVVNTGVPTTTALVANASTVPLSGRLTLTATVSSTTPGTLAGTVVFSAGTATLGTSPLVVGAGGNTGTATLTITVNAASLPVGNDSITATYGGGGTPTGAVSYLGSTSSAVVVTVTNPTITLTATNIAFAVGSSGTSTVTVTSGGGYAGTVTFAAATQSTALSTYGSAAFNPTSVVVAQGANGTTTLTISTAGATSSFRQGAKLKLIGGGVSWLATGGGLSLAGLLLFGPAGLRRRRLPGLLLSLLALAAVGSAVGCGSSSTASGSSGNIIPKGAYTITVTATDNTNASLSGSTTLTLTLN